MLATYNTQTQSANMRHMTEKKLEKKQNNHTRQNRAVCVVSSVAV